jgi:hypothetical protein
MNLFWISSYFPPAKVKHAWGWVLFFGALPWVVLIIALLPFHFAGSHYLSSGTTLHQAVLWSAALLLQFVAGYLIWVYEKRFHALAVALVDKDRDPSLDDPDLIGFITTSPHHSPRIGWLLTTPAKKIEHLNFVLGRLQSRIGDEYTDISSRVSWLITGQAFLLAAFVSILNINTGLIGDDARRWFAAWVAFSGWVISFGLAVSTALGHALIEKLKKPRDKIETFLAKNLAVPRAGVPPHHSAHRIGHAATRYLPVFAFVAWSFLTLLSISGHLSQADKTKTDNPPAGMMAYVLPSPAFPIAATTYALTATNSGCPDNLLAADAWIDGFLARWAKRPQPSQDDGIVLIGSSDRLNLSTRLKQQIDSNLSLGRARAETIRNMLLHASIAKAASAKDGHYLINEVNIMVLATAPANLAHPEQSSKSKRDCLNPELAVDRTVRIWVAKKLPN